MEHNSLGMHSFHLHPSNFIQEEVVRKTRSYERMKAEAEKCLVQSEKICSEKLEFENAVYAKVCHQCVP